VTFTGALNKAHVQWLEHRLLVLARDAGQCVLENGNAPQAPYLSEHELADVAGFLEQVLRILPPGAGSRGGASGRRRRCSLSAT
jgi:hypothetical protein